MEIRIKKEYEALLPPLPPKEYDALKQSIRENGLLVPIMVNREGDILDGHNRFKICKELGIEPRHGKPMEFENPILEKRFVIESNLQRRHLNTFSKIEMALPLLKVERELARQRMLAGHPRTNLSEGGKTLEIVAKRIGVSYGTFEMALEVIKEADEDEKGKLRSGEHAISAAYKEIMRERRIRKLKEKAKHLVLPKGKYSVIVVDPPWPYGTEYDPEGRRVASPYPEMSLEELEELELPSADDCVLWLWTTNRFIHDAFHLLEAWEFDPKTILTWVKPRMGIGVWLRGKTEHCILAVKGKPVINLTNQTTALSGKIQGHSRKPDEFYKLVDSLCMGRKLDYFARGEREGWDTYGTEELEE